jgi:cell wall-associated NlpC family hydrolase
MQSQQAWAIPSYITILTSRGTYLDHFGWGDQLQPDPLRQRHFRSGVNDCYSLVRHAYHKAFNVVLPDGPRAMDWWDDPQAENPITSNLTKAGFHPVAQDEIRQGDCVTFAIRQGVVSHCGVYIGHSLFLHHLHGRLSKVDPLPYWRRFMHSVVRYAPGAQHEERQ